jgi:hypothetical protein
MLRHSRESVAAPPRPDVPHGVLLALSLMTARKPDQRFQTPGEVVAALEQYSVSRGPRATPRPLPVVEESLTDDELPVPYEKTDSRFALPPSAAQPRSHRKGCLGVLLSIASAIAIGLVIAL